MEVCQLRQLVDALGDARVRDFLGISAATLRRWKTNKCRIPHAAALALRLHFDGDLSAICEAWQGFRLCGDLLYMPMWERGTTPDSLRAMFFELQELAALRAENKRLRVLADGLRGEVQRERFRADEYRQMSKSNAYGARLLNR